MSENNLIKPIKLCPGDTIGIISPAGVVKDDNIWRKAVKYFENKGYYVKLALHAKEKKWYMAGEDKGRLSDLMDFFKDDSIKAIMCSRGGYGTYRILSGIDFRIIQKNPKIFVGYSDITALLTAFVHKANLVAFHGPLALSDFGRDEINGYTEKSFFDVLEGRISIPFRYDNPLKYECIYSGVAKGDLVGGNLAVLTGLLGTEFFPDVKGKILFLEDIGEPLYKIDRMLMQLKLAGVFDQISGLLFGEFTSIFNSDDPEINKLSAIAIIKDILKETNIPVGFGFPAGHGDNKATLPLGVNYIFNSDNGSLILNGDYIS